MLYNARIKGKTTMGNRYVGLQDAPGRFHITVQKGDTAIYDLATQVTSEQDLLDRANQLELELYPPLLKGIADEVA